MDDFYTARSKLIPPLPWPTFAPPFSLHDGSWKADTYLLGRVVDLIEHKRPATVVELGSGATSLVIAKALSLHGGGKLYSFDQHRSFISDMNRWLA